MLKALTIQKKTNQVQQKAICESDFDYPLICSFGIPIGVAFSGVYLKDFDYSRSKSIYVLAFVVADVKVNFPTEIGLLTNLIGLIIYSSSITGTIPTQIGRLTKLAILFIGFEKQLHGPIPTEIGLLKSLGYCAFISNGLVGTLPSELGKLSQLTKIQLSKHTSITGSFPSQLGKLSKIEEIIIYFNEMDGTFPSEFCLLTSLQVLSVDQNQLSGTIPDCLPNMTSLLTLGVDRNRFTGEIPSNIILLKSLDTIRAFNNLFTGTLPTEYGLMTTLTRLDIDNNLISGTIPTEFGNIPNLEMFRVIGNELTGTIPSEFGKCIHLNFLQFSNNTISGTLPSQLALLTARIDVYNTQLSGTIPSGVRLVLCDYSGLDSSQCKSRDSDTTSVNFLDEKILIACTCLISILCVVIIVTAILILKKRNTDIIRATNYIFALISLFGLFLMSFSVIPFGFSLIETNNNDFRRICACIFAHFLFDGIVIVLVCIILRNYPLWRVFDNPQLKPISIRPSDLIKYVLVFILISISLMTPISTEFFVTETNFRFQMSKKPFVDYIFVILSIFITLLAIVAGWLCYKIRNVPSRFSNTKDVAWATYCMLTLGVTTAIIGTLATTALFLYTTMFLAIVFSVSTFTFLVHIKKLVYTLAPISLRITSTDHLVISL
eukprot:c21566_g1_i1.p1 GENE.c21566_g1_i1~~c21566_g1_i1.p1  ORF type:complete len:725 (+),score=99.89 c21566_g1_i1:193-2175(+)